MLGSDLVPIWRKSMEISAFSHRQCDVSDISAVNAAIERERPDIVLMLAAATDVDRCQTDHEYAFRTNSTGTEIVAQACSRWKAAMVYISSIAVFSGEKEMKFVARILRKISSNNEIRMVRDCVGSPTGTMDLSRGIMELVDWRDSLSEYIRGTLKALMQ